VTCCGDCQTKIGSSNEIEWGPQGFKIRQDETFLVEVPSRFAGWKSAYGPVYERGEECGNDCGTSTAHTPGEPALRKGRFSDRSGQGDAGVDYYDWPSAGARPPWERTHVFADQEREWVLADAAAIDEVFVEHVPDWYPDLSTDSAASSLGWVGRQSLACTDPSLRSSCCVGIACRPVDGWQGITGAKHCIFIKQNCVGEITSYQEGTDGSPGERIGDTKIFKNATAGLGGALFGGVGASQEVKRGGDKAPTVYTTAFLTCYPCVAVVCSLLVDLCDSKVNDDKVLEYPFGGDPWNINPFDCIPDNVCNTFAAWMGEQAGIDAPLGDWPDGAAGAEYMYDPPFVTELISVAIGEWF